ncbi:NfeD family protein [Salinispira pacifica]
MGWLLSVYIGAAVFGVGVTLVDLLGLLGSHEGDHAGSSDQDAGGHGDDDFGGNAGESAEAASPELDAAPEALADHDAADQNENVESVTGHDRPERRSYVLRLLTIVRSIIYFCLGFGPVGWFALATTGSAVTSLYWSVPVGVVALFGTRALRRFMRRELNSEISTSELLMERGVVIVSIGAGELGRVRIKLGDVYVERFARAASPETAIHAGTTVRVTDVSEECVYVEEE